MFLRISVTFVLAPCLYEAEIRSDSSVLLKVDGFAELRDFSTFGLFPGRQPVEKVADLHARLILALTMELCHLCLKKFLGNEKPATRSPRLRFFART